MSGFPDTGHFGCRLPFGLGMMAFFALAILALTLAVYALPLLFGGGLPGPGSGPGSGPGQGQGPVDLPIPPVSDRFFAGGDVATTVTGDLQLTGTLELDPIASYAQEGLVWISFRDGSGTEVLIALNEPEDSVTVAQGTTVAIGRDEACAFDIEVTGALVSGSVTCADVAVERDGKSAGQATISVQFEASTDAEAGG